MSENKFETISALVDNYQAVTSTNRSESLNEFVTEHSIDEMLNDEHLSSTWQRYHLIGDVIRDEIPQAIQLDLSNQIAATIAQEPTILAPKTAPITNDLSNSSNKTGAVILSFVARSKAKVVELAKPLGQVAIAASAAGLMIIGVQQNTVSNDATIVMPSQIVQTMPVTGIADPVSFNFESTSLKANRELQKKIEMKQKIAQQRRFQALLLDHNQQVKFTSVANSKVNRPSQAK